MEMVLPVKSNRFLIFTRPFNRLESAWVNVNVIVRILSNVREKVEWPHGSGGPGSRRKPLFPLSPRSPFDPRFPRLPFEPFIFPTLVTSSFSCSDTVVIAFILDDSCRLRALPGSVSRLRVTTS